jgi:hypothetical protein
VNPNREKKDKLFNALINAEEAWCMQRTWGGGDGHRIFLEPPLDFGLDHPLRDSEPIVFRRSFMGMSSFSPPIEINQKLVHSLGLHFLEDRKVFCRLNDEGDLEEVIHVFQDEGTGNFDSRACVLIKSKTLAEYMAVGAYALFRKFDVTRHDSRFSEWEGAESHFDAQDLFYNCGRTTVGSASYIHGGQILRPAVTVEELVEEWKQSEDPASREYETFLIHDWKNDQIVECSSAPDELSNYFQQSAKPFELSPAFFSPEVLTKYKADPEKYDLRDRSITCRNSWCLKTYDINDAGQVHTYIGYLQHLPHREQRHWKLYNERPKMGLSRRAIETDFEGKYSSIEDPLESLKHTVDALDQNQPLWWSQRGSELIRRVHYPVTTSSKEWADELQLLDQLIVEGFVATELRRMALAAGAQIDARWQSLKTIQVLLATRGNSNADDLVGPLRRLHHLRSKVSGHHTTERAQLEKDAFAEHGSLNAHFRSLCCECNESFTTIFAALRAIP